MYPRQAKRWLATNSTQWRRLRALVLDSEPMCRHCIEDRTATPQPATEVDHIDGRCERREDYRRDNLQGLCESHHSAKTSAENGSFGRAPGKARRRGCTVDGIPLDRRHHWTS